MALDAQMTGFVPVCVRVDYLLDVSAQLVNKKISHGLPLTSKKIG